MTTSHQYTLDRFFSGTIDDKLATMEQVYECHGVQLLENTTIMKSIALLREHTANLSRQMKSMDMGSLCCRCARHTGGGCCSSYMEANSDTILLLMNRLYGTRVNKQHDNTDECCFLGSSGCILPIKPMFCLNYNCSHIHARATGPEMVSLELLAGRMLMEQTRLEAVILQQI